MVVLCISLLITHQLWIEAERNARVLLATLTGLLTYGLVRAADRSMRVGFGFEKAEGKRKMPGGQPKKAAYNR